MARTCDIPYNIGPKVTQLYPTEKRPSYSTLVTDLIKYLLTKLYLLTYGYNVF